MMSDTGEEDLRNEVSTKRGVEGTDNVYQNKPISSLVINLGENGEITTITGPVNNPIMVMDIIGRALEIIARHIAKSEMERQLIAPAGPKIVTLN